MYYVTYKYVVLNDRRLGAGYYSLALLIVLYTLVEIFINRGYLEFDVRPQGTVKLILSDDFARENFSAEVLPYCHGNTECKYVDPMDLNWPPEARAVTLTTFAKDRVQRLQSNSNSPLDEYATTSETTYFTQGPEYVVIKVDHAVVATQFTDSKGKERLAASHRKLRGYLADYDGDSIRELSPDPGKPDKVSLQELLEAAGVESLDVAADSVNARDRSFRERGLILRVTVTYNNWRKSWFGTGDIEYVYHVRRVPYVNYSSKEVHPLMDRGGTDPSEEGRREGPPHSPTQPSWRLLRKRYAVRVEFEQSGSLGMFSVGTLLLKLVSGMGLLTLTATVMDVLALYVLPSRNRYKRFVFEESPQVRHGKRQEEEESREAKKEKPN